MSVKSVGLKVLIVFLIASVVENPCTTGDNAQRICVPKMTCGFIRELLSAWPDPPPNHVQEYIQKTQCGTFNGDIYVCCLRHLVSSDGLIAAEPMQLSTIRAPQTDTKIQRVGIKSDEDIAIGMDILRSMECGNPTAGSVTNAEDAVLGEFPWMVLLVYDNGIETSLKCEGSLITDQYVLTAAHCIRTYGDSRLVRVRLGEYDTKYDPDCVGGTRRKCAPLKVEIEVEEALYHQDFSRTKFSDDIGLIRLARKATIGPYVSPVCLPITQSSQNAIVPKMQMAGWDQVKTGLREIILQKTNVVIKDNSYCEDFYKVITLTSAQMCAVRENMLGSCKAEGPLFSTVRYGMDTRSVQYGVLGSGSPQCRSESPSVFASVPSHLNWIAGNLRR